MLHFCLLKKISKCKFKIGFINQTDSELPYWNGMFFSVWFSKFSGSTEKFSLHIIQPGTQLILCKTVSKSSLLFNLNIFKRNLTIPLFPFTCGLLLLNSWLMFWACCLPKSSLFCLPKWVRLVWASFCENFEQDKEGIAVLDSLTGVEEGFESQ